MRPVKAWRRPPRQGSRGSVADIRHPPHAVGFDGQESLAHGDGISKVGYAPMADQCHRSPSGTQTSKL